MNIEAWWPCYIEIPESSSPEKWIMLDRPCNDRNKAETLANSILKPGTFYRIACHDKILCTNYTVEQGPVPDHSIEDKNCPECNEDGCNPCGAVVAEDCICAVID
jgi:hypothetical protein